MEKKCSCCGSTKMYELDERDFLTRWNLEGTVGVNAEIYICFDCNHIELFANKELIRKANNKFTYEQELKKIEKSLDEEFETKKKEADELDAKVIPLNKEIESIKNKLLDENITVKQQRELQEALAEKEKQAKILTQSAIKLRETSKAEYQNKERALKQALYNKYKDDLRF